MPKPESHLKNYEVVLHNRSQEPRLPGVNGKKVTLYLRAASPSQRRTGDLTPNKRPIKVGLTPWICRFLSKSTQPIKSKTPSKTCYLLQAKFCDGQRPPTTTKKIFCTPRAMCFSSATACHLVDPPQIHPGTPVRSGRSSGPPLCRFQNISKSKCCKSLKN